MPLTPRRTRSCRRFRATRFSEVAIASYLAPAPAAFPAFRRIRSSAYLMPFPLYGSGGRRPRICAVTSPRICRLFACTVSTVCRSTDAWTPSGTGTQLDVSSRGSGESRDPSLRRDSLRPTISKVRVNPVSLRQRYWRATCASTRARPVLARSSLIRVTVVRHPPAWP